MLSIHTPETEGEKNPDNVAQSLKKWKITYPVLLDRENKNWLRWQQQYWPTAYLIDKRGHVRYYWIGELEWNRAGGEKIMERYIQKLLNEPDDDPETATEK
jgi:hypothetical protein